MRQSTRWERVFRMGPAELLYRGRQETHKWLERVGALGRANGHPPQGTFHSMTAGRSQVETSARALARAPGGAGGMFSDRFFEGALEGETVAMLIENLPHTRENILAAAEAVGQRRFHLMGYEELFFGDPVDWHLDPVSGRGAPKVHWSRIDPLNPAQVGDSKIIWELNRHQWLLPLGQAYRLTGDERYAETFAGLIREWMGANQPGIGINWASSLEAALRLISWCWALELFRASKALSDDLCSAMVASIWNHASHIERYLSYYFSPNTHLTGEALGLFYAGTLFPEGRSTRRWQEVGASILVQQCERQVMADGVYFEQSTCYQRYTAEIYLHFLILAARNGIGVPDIVANRLQRLLDFLMAVRRPDGSMPQIGDADGGWLFPVVPRATDDLRGVFSIAAAFFGRSDYAWAAGGLAPETLWLLGEPALKTFESLHPTPPATAPSRFFPHGGYAVMRSGWERDAHQLIFDLGPLGCPMSGGHGHADLLSFQCSVFGEPYLIDPGTYCYTPDRKWRDFFRGTAAHSAITVDDIGQAVPTAPFAWKMRPRARLRQYLSDEALDLVDADHDAYRRLVDPVVHRRRVLFVKPRYWVVVDDLYGAAEHSFELRFQFAPIEVTVDPTLWARARGRRGQGLFIRPFATIPLKARVVKGEIDPIGGWISPDYGQRRPAPLLVYSAVTRLPLRLLTLLFPMQDPLAVPPAISLLLDGDAVPSGLVFEQGGERIRFDEQGVVTQ